MYACIIFYNDTVELLGRAISSVKRYGFDTILVDGAYEEFLHKEVQSTDGCAEYACRLANIYIVPPLGGWKDQVHKRNAAFDAVPMGEYALIIDADEELLKFDPGELLEDVYRLNIVINSGVDYQSMIRIVKKTRPLIYRHDHSHLFLGANLLTCESTLRKCLIWHNDYLRPQERKNNKLAYYLSRNEKHFTKQDFL